ncbi:MAG: hypothetical protein Q9188_004370 [Gyalolechia gomerana]
MSITLIKVSTLVFYRRVFITGRFHRACNLMFALTGGWFLTATLGQIFSCKPISDSWTFFTHRSGHCPIGITNFQLSLAAINMTLDLVIVCMPLFVISRLHMDIKQKWAVGGIFMLGAFCVVASIVRLYYFVRLSYGSIKDADTPYTRIVTYTILWSFIECCTSIIAACLPTLAPLGRDILGRDNQRLDSIIRSVRSMLALRSSASKTSFDKHQQTGNARFDEHGISCDTWQQSNFCAHLEDCVSGRGDRAFEDKTKLLADAQAFRLQISLPSESLCGLKGTR